MLSHEMALRIGTTGIVDKDGNFRRFTHDKIFGRAGVRSGIVNIEDGWSDATEWS